MAKSNYFVGGSTLALALTLGLGGPAVAQTAATPAANDDEEVVITGSFIRGTPEDSALPVEVMTLQEIQNLGSPSNMDLVKNMTEIGSVVGETNRYNAYPIGAQTINLRNLSSGRTVVVFNGRRFPEQYSANTGRFNNISQIPNAAIGRIETLKEGGAIAFGADAVGGVVNYITRNDFRGLQVNGNYRFIQDSDGDYDADLLWGQANDDGNIMLSAAFAHRSALMALDRDWADREYLENNNGSAWSASGNPGAYVFQRNAGGTFSTITPNATGASDYTPTPEPTTGSRRAMGPTGVMRDPLCTELGGFAGWSATPSPVCYYHITQNEKLAEDQDQYTVYGEANYHLSDTMKLHVEGLYYGLRLPQIAAQPGDAALNFPIAVGSATGAAQVVGTSSAYFVPGTNPAFRLLTQQMTNSDGASNAVSTLPDTARAGLILGTWRPFGNGGNPLTGAYDIQRNQTDQYRTTFELSDDLPSIFGADLRWTGALTYNRTVYSVAINDILVDRMQQALNGFGGPSCDTNPATPNIVEGPGNVVRPARTTGDNVPGCYYFNPFSSATVENYYNGAVNPLYDPSSAMYNTIVQGTGQGAATGTFSGYMPGQGLQNNPEVVRWLYVPIRLDRDYDMMVADFKIDGALPLELPGGPISVAVGGQYRYTKEQFALDNYSDRDVNPCATIGVTTCVNRTGPLLGSRGATVLGTTLESQREYPVWSAFAQAALPIFDNLNVDIATRYEKFISDVSPVNNDIVVSQAGVKWQVTDNVALRSFAGSTFSQVNPPLNNGPTIANTVANISTFQVGGSGNSLITRNYDNDGVKPETGFNYNVGALFNFGNFRANVDYYNIKIGDYARTLTTTNVLQALIKPGQPSTGSALLNCSSPLLTQSVPGLDNQPFVVLNGPCVQDTTTITSGLGGGTGAAINYFGGFQEVNAGELQTTGVDVGLSYRFDDILGGVLTTSFDLTKILSYDFGEFTVAGIAVAPGFDGVASMNEAPGKNGQHIAEYRGVLGFNFTHGRHNLNVNTRWMSSLEQDQVALFAEANNTNANATTAASQIVTCGPDTNPTSDLGQLPAGFGQGEYGASGSVGALGQAVGYCADQNQSIVSGIDGIPDTFNTDISYRLRLPWQTSLTATVQNVFDKDPEFSRDPQSYDAFTGSPLGRTIRVGLTKKF